MLAPISRAFVTLLAVAAVLACGSALAQTCHPLELPEQAEQPFRASLGFVLAGYDLGDEHGSYEGLSAAFAYRQRWVGAELVLPAYRLERAGEVEMGLGDLVLAVRGTALRVLDERVAMGVELPLMLPTGDAERQLGMGHVMLMPALWFTLDLEPFSLGAQAGYGRVLGSIDSHRAHRSGVGRGRSPLVNPMNREEFAHALTLSLGVQRYVSVHARWLGAVAIGEGVTRQVLGAGTSLRFPPGEVLLELQKALAGAPFDLKLLLTLALRF